MYHEIRELSMLHPDQSSPIKVRQNYEDNLPSPLFVSLENFQKQMDYLYENGYQTLTLAQIIGYYHNGVDLPEKSVLLTFDDCYQSIARYVYPFLKKYHFNATAFVVTGWLNISSETFKPDRSVCLTEEELEPMADIFEYANHTDLFHTRTGMTTSIMMEVSDQELSEDLDRCNANPLIMAKTVFAYPFGLYADRNVELLRSKGFKLAFTSDNGRNESNTDPMLLKRNAIPYFMTLEDFKKLL
jgi:peptidoglycan/xylan/chitin deacetylase (PgdA/CDA1 family)